jgi:prepilin-type N-terminal cleavage/methylation domain-containing protein
MRATVPSPRRGFTLIELLVVIAIVAVLAVTVILTLNPAELLKQTRDSNRLSDLDTINKALSIVQADITNPSYGTSTTLYISVPDSSTSCANLGLPALPSGYAYGCAPTSTLRNTDGTGWIPVNFNLISSGSPLSGLPIDPSNSTSTGLYYSYIANAGWELNSIVESQKYRSNTQISKQGFPGIISVGNNQSLSPIANTSGLIGYWPFSEGAGATAFDLGGSGNNGTLTIGATGSQTTVAQAWSNGGQGKVGSALHFDGTDDWVDMGLKTVWDNLVNNFSVSVWVKSDTPQQKRLVSKGYNSQWEFELRANNTCALNYNLGAGFVGKTSYVVLDSNWHLCTFVIANSNVYFWVDGVLRNTQAVSVPFVSVPANKLFVGSHGGGADGTLLGSLDDVRVYNRVLSAAEVQAIYNATR